MTQSDIGNAPSSSSRANIRAVGRAWAIAVVVVGVVSVPIVALGDWPTASGIGLSAMGVGALLMLTAGSLFERVTTLGSSGWGVEVNRHRDEAGRPYSDIGSLTSTGLAILVGLPLVVAGAFLF